MITKPSKAHQRFLVALTLAGQGAGERLSAEAGTTLSRLHKTSRRGSGLYYPTIQGFIAEQYEKHREILTLE